MCKCVNVQMRKCVNVQISGKYCAKRREHGVAHLEFRI